MGSNTGVTARTVSDATTSVAWPPADLTAGRTMFAPASGPASTGSRLSQISSAAPIEIEFRRLHRGQN